MHRLIRTASAGMLSSALLAALLASSVSPVAATTPAAAPPADIAPALSPDGTFRGAPGVAGTISTAAWTLVSDLAAGEPPRFAPASQTVAPLGHWSALGSNGSGNGAINNWVTALAVSDSDLYVGGQFFNAAGIAEADYVAKWDGTTWSALGSNGPGTGAIYGYVNALAVSGSDVYVGGNFINAAGIAEADYVAKWDSVTSTWSALGSNGGGNGAINNQVHALAASGSDVYVGGFFLNAAGIPEADYVAKWNGSTWSALGSNGAGDGAIYCAGCSVNALAVSGSELYMGGNFTISGIPEAAHVAKWDGSTWSALGSNGAGGPAIGGPVNALAVSGGDLYAGGGFADAGGIPAADFVAKWNGSAWSALGSSAAGNGALNNVVRAIAVSGTDLYVGGIFNDAAGVAAADGLARWNGSSWSALDSDNSAGPALTNGGGVCALAVSGTGLYISGLFADVAGIATADNIAKWAPIVVVRRPDAQIRLGTSGAWVGNNVYNTTGSGQSKTGSAAKGHIVTFGISIQNDGNAADSFKVKATGTASSKFTVKYYKGATDITAKVVAGTYSTGSLAAGSTQVLTVKVTVKSSAAVGNSVTRLVTITSVGSSTQKDAVKLIAKRK